MAPTPSGYLHWGNLFNFAETWAWVRASGGRLGLRIDDMDASRLRPEYVDDLFSTLNYLGFDWDFGPKDAADFWQNFSQSKNQKHYFQLLQAGKEKGMPLYTCTCSRSELKARTGQTSHYDGHCYQRQLEFLAGESTLRIRLPQVHDPMLWTREDQPAYVWASIVDDERDRVTHVVRGEDLRETTQVQNTIQAEWARVRGLPPWSVEFRFHPLLLDSSGKKLSKSADAESLKDWIDRGQRPEAIWAMLSQKVKIPQEVHSLRDWKCVYGSNTFNAV
jgi:glutamyl/glutaminyl-tRNA synthetase